MLVALALAGVAAAQTVPASPARPPVASAPAKPGELVPEDDFIMVPDRERVRVRPDPEIMKLARRIAELAREPDVSRALAELFERERKPQPPPLPPGPSAPIVLRPNLPMVSQEEVGRGLEATERLTERIAQFYAATFTLGELREMAAFFESPTGRRYVARRRDATAHGLAAIAEPSFQALAKPRCAPEGGEGPQDGPNHAYVRLPVRMDAETSDSCRSKHRQDIERQP